MGNEVEPRDFAAAVDGIAHLSRSLALAGQRGCIERGGARQAEHVILERLQSHSLGPTKIALALGASVRYLRETYADLTQIAVSVINQDSCFGVVGYR